MSCISLNIRHGEMDSEQFKALIGLPMGDRRRRSYGIFLSNLILLPVFEDVFLARVRMPLLPQADDLLIISLSVHGLRGKLTTLERSVV
jgi:hypothetical protein